MDPEQIQVPEIPEVSLPPEIRRAEERMKQNKAAFALPPLPLPSYEDIGKSVNKVFDRQGNTLSPRKPTFEERLDDTTRKYQSAPNQLNPIGEYSKAQAEGFNDPSIPYDPTVDMNEVYAKYDPVTWGDVAEKTWDTAYINAWSGMKNLWYGLKEGITEGRASAIWDNSYSKELADMTLNLEKEKPFRFTKEEQGTTSAWLKQVLPSLGYVAAGAAEVAAQHAVLTLGGAAIGAISGEGIGAVPGAIAGNVAAYAKDAQTMANAITNIGRASRAVAAGEAVGSTVSALSAANKIKSAGQMFGRGLLATNGEASLMGQLAANRSLEEQKAQYFKETGQYLTGDGLKSAEDTAKKTAGAVYAQNLPLLAAGEIYMFGNLLRGKAVPSVVDKLAFKIDKATGRAVMGSPAMKVIGSFAGNAAVQGNEEVLQSVIEDASVGYFTQKKKNRDNYLESFTDSLFKRASSGEALSDFMSGAVIGAIPGSVELAGYGAVKKNSQAAIDQYNNATEIYFNRLGENLKTNDRLKDALLTGDSISAREEYRNHIIGLVNTLSRTGSLGSFSETLDALEMRPEEFNKYTGLHLTAEEQEKAMSGVREEFKSAAKIRTDVDTAFQVNPFEAESWFQQKLNKHRSSFQVDREKAQEVWDVFKSTLTSNIIRHDHASKQRQELEDIGSQALPEFMSYTGTDAQDVVNRKKEDLRAKIDARLPGWAQDRRDLERIEAQQSLAGQYNEVLNIAERLAPGAKELLQWHQRELDQENIFYNEIGRLNSKTGQRKEIKKIVDWQNWYEKAVTGTTEENVVTGNSDGKAVIQAGEQIPADTVVPAQPAQETVQPTAQPTAPQVEPVPAAESEAVAPEVAPAPVAPVEPVAPEIAVEDAFVPDYTDELTESELEALYGEGKGDDFVPTDTPAKKEEAPVQENKVPVRPIDSSLPEDIQVDEAVVPEAVGNLSEGQKIVPEDSGTDVTFKGEKLTEIRKEKGKVKAKKEDGKDIEIPPSDIPLLRTEKAQESPSTRLASYIAENNISGEKELLLRSLADNGFIELDCG